jgi:L-malate glycosyltransferase
MKQVRVLLVWTGGVNPAYLPYFESLARYVKLDVFTPHHWKHGSVDFTSNQTNSTGSTFSLKIVRFIRFGSAFYFSPNIIWNLFRIRPDILYIMDEPDRVVVTFHAIISKLLVSKLKVCSYSLQNMGKPSYYNWSHQLAWMLNRRLLDGLIAATEEAKQLILNHNFQQPLKVIPLFASESLFTLPTAEEKNNARKNLNLKDDQFVLCFAGSLHPAKGVMRLWNGIQSQPNLRLLIASGDPWPDLPMQKSKPIHLGRLQGKELLRMYHAADAVVLPSESTPFWKEQMGRILLEGGLCGCLTLGSDSGAITEVIADVHCTFKSGDELDLIRMLRMLPMPDHALRIHKQRQRFLNLYSTDAVAKATGLFLQTLVTESV